MKTLCLILVICFFYSCRTECTCGKDLGCMIVKVKKKIYRFNYCRHHYLFDKSLFVRH